MSGYIKTQVSDYACRWEAFQSTPPGWHVWSGFQTRCRPALHFAPGVQMAPSRYQPSAMLCCKMPMRCQSHVRLYKGVRQIKLFPLISRARLHWTWFLKVSIYLQQSYWRWAVWARCHSGRACLRICCRGQVLQLARNKENRWQLLLLVNIDRNWDTS